MKHKQKKHKDDDGRVIVNMNVDGMPWHDSSPRQEESEFRVDGQGALQTKSESRLYTWYAVLTALMIGLVFSLTWVLFTLFCTKVWFR